MPAPRRPARMAWGIAGCAGSSPAASAAGRCSGTHKTSENKRLSRMLIVATAANNGNRGLLDPSEPVGGLSRGRG